MLFGKNTFRINIISSKSFTKILFDKKLLQHMLPGQKSSRTKVYRSKVVVPMVLLAMSLAQLLPGQKPIKQTQFEK
jgi:hypothetical protein